MSPARDPGRPAGAPSRPLATALAEGPVLLDGGLSNQLEAQGCDLSDALWSARLLADGPEQIEAAHTAYVRAGAQVLITASYQASFAGFRQRGIGRAAAAGLFARSVELARRAAGSVDREVWVAASVGPYGAVTADGAEYRGRYGLTVGELERFHRPRIEALAAKPAPMRWRWRRCRTWMRRRRCCGWRGSAGCRSGSPTPWPEAGPGPGNGWRRRSLSSPERSRWWRQG